METKTERCLTIMAMGGAAVCYLARGHEGEHKDQVACLFALEAQLAAANARADEAEETIRLLTEYGEVTLAERDALRATVAGLCEDLEYAWLALRGLPAPGDEAIERLAERRALKRLMQHSDLLQTTAAIEQAREALAAARSEAQ